ncbi:MAG: VWA domain-containing protein [Planctomycetota bacterium]|nr:MAG: VWA domain-containing protein [Planctomycetota bacterium]
MARRRPTGGPAVSGFGFDLPGALVLLLALPVLAAVQRVDARRRRHRLWGAAGPRAAAAGSGRASFRTSGTVLALLVLALAGPRLGPSPGRSGAGADLLVVLDVSRSMLARDLAPDRLERARADIRDLVEAGGGDRFGLVLFAGEARLAAPLTRDRTSFLALLALAGPESVPRGGTDLGAALERAAAALGAGRGPEPERPAAVLLLSDGEDLEGRGREAALALAAAGIPVHCIGYGRRAGARIPVAADGGEQWLLDRNGRPVQTAVDARGLASLAAATGGRFVLAAEEEAPLRTALGRPAGAAPGAEPAARSLADPILAAALLLGIMALRRGRTPW